MWIHGAAFSAWMVFFILQSALVFVRKVSVHRLDVLMAPGMVRDWVVEGRIHKVYLYALPPMIAIQSLAVYLWRI